LVALADELASRPADSTAATAAPTLADLVAEVDERMAAQHAPEVDGVTLASLHAAKGLEWDAVFLVGMSEGLMPISLAETDAAVAEERRLLYVGVTRAREHLELSFAMARNPGGRHSRERTRFLDGIWPDGPRGTGSGGTRATSPRAGIAWGGGARRGAPGGFAPGSGAPGSDASGGGAPGAGSRSGGGSGLQHGRRVRLTGDYDPELFAALREWRASVAEAQGRPAYTVFADATLEAV